MGSPRERSLNSPRKVEKVEKAQGQKPRQEPKGRSGGVRHGMSSRAVFEKPEESKHEKEIIWENSESESTRKQRANGEPRQEPKGRPGGVEQKIRSGNSQRTNDSSKQAWGSLASGL